MRSSPETTPSSMGERTVLLRLPMLLRELLRGRLTAAEEENDETTGGEGPLMASEDDGKVVAIGLSRGDEPDLSRLLVALCVTRRGAPPLLLRLRTAGAPLSCWPSFAGSGEAILRMTVRSPEAAAMSTAAVSPRSAELLRPLCCRLESRALPLPLLPFERGGETRSDEDEDDDDEGTGRTESRPLSIDESPARDITFFMLRRRASSV